MQPTTAPLANVGGDGIGLSAVGLTDMRTQMPNTSTAAIPQRISSACSDRTLDACTRRFYPGLTDVALGQDTIVVRHYGPATLTLRRGRRPKESKPPAMLIWARLTTATACIDPAG
jgi:hypothetical protein